MTSATEASIFCAEQDGEGKTVEKGRISVEIMDGAAILAVTRLYLAGATMESIAEAMKYGLLPPKTK